MCIPFGFATANGKNCKRLLSLQTQQHMALPCTMCWSRHCRQISTTLEQGYQSSTSGTETFLQMPDNLKLIRDKQLICRDSCRKRHSLLDNSNQTSSFGRKRIFLRCSQILRNLSQTVYESSILGFHQWHPHIMQNWHRKLAWRLPLWNVVYHVLPGMQFWSLNDCWPCQQHTSRCW